jgi:membrane protein DedA with SNARE-associated domain
VNVPHLSELVSHYGYFAAFGMIVLQSAGLPLPGEGLLIAAAVYAQRTHRLDIFALVAVAAVASFLGSILGYVIGRWGGHPLLARFGKHVGLGEARMRLGEYLFLKHGGKIMLYGRMMAVLRVYAAILAGTYYMPAGRFLVFSAAGAVLWAAVVAYGAYAFGELFGHVSHLIAWSTLGLGVLIAAASVVYLHRKEGDLQEAADLALLTRDGVFETVDNRQG